MSPQSTPRSSERLKDHLSLHARVDEHQRRGVALDQIVDVLERVAGRVPGPRQFRVGIEHRDDWRGTALRHDQVPARKQIHRRFVAIDAPIPASPLLLVARR